MQFAPISRPQAGDVKIPAFGILVFIGAIYVAGAVSSHYWPWYQHLPGMRREREYDWLDLLLAAIVFAPIMRNTRMSWRAIAGPWPDCWRGIGIAMSVGILAFSIVIVFQLIGAALLTIDGSLVPSDRILGSFGVRRSPEWGLLYQPGYWVGTISACLIVPVIEEFFFRGLLLRRLLAAWRPWLAVSLSSFVFMLIHVGHPLPFPFLSGVLFAVLYLRTGSLWLGMIAHGTTNALMAGARITIRFEYDDRYAISGIPATILLAISGSLLLIALVVKLIKYLDESASPQRNPSLRALPHANDNTTDAGHRRRVR